MGLGGREACHPSGTALELEVDGVKITRHPGVKLLEALETGGTRGAVHLPLQLLLEFLVVVFQLDKGVAGKRGELGHRSWEEVASSRWEVLLEQFLSSCQLFAVGGAPLKYGVATNVPAGTSVPAKVSGAV